VIAATDRIIAQHQYRQQRNSILQSDVKWKKINITKNKVN
jgi:hypothetical protein